MIWKEVHSWKVSWEALSRSSTKSICYDEALLDKIAWENRNKGMLVKVVNA